MFLGEKTKTPGNSASERDPFCDGELLKTTWPSNYQGSSLVTDWITWRNTVETPSINLLQGGPQEKPVISVGWILNSTEIGGEFHPMWNLCIFGPFNRDPMTPPCWILGCFGPMTPSRPVGSLPKIRSWGHPSVQIFHWEQHFKVHSKVNEHCAVWKNHHFA